MGAPKCENNVLHQKPIHSDSYKLPGNHKIHAKLGKIHAKLGKISMLTSKIAMLTCKMSLNLASILASNFIFAMLTCILRLWSPDAKIIFAMLTCNFGLNLASILASNFIFAMLTCKIQDFGRLMYDLKIEAQK